MSTFLGLAIAEIAMRLVLRRETLMDQTGSDYWTVVLEEKLRAGKGEWGPDIDPDPELGWRMRPGNALPGQTVSSGGFRGSREYSVEKPPGVRRIMLLGDSQTFGFGLKDEETLGMQLEKRLPAGFEVLNASANGWGTDQQYLYWMRDGRRYDPDIIILGFYFDDFTRTSATCREYLKPRLIGYGDDLTVTQTPIPTPEELLKRGLPRFNGRLRLVELIEHVWQRIRWKIWEQYQPEERFQQSAKVVSLILKRLRETTIGRGEHLVVALFPSHMYEREFDAVRIEKMVTRICRSQGIPVLDLAPALKAAATSPNAVFAVSTHWTPHGAEVVADTLRGYLREEGLVP